MKALLLLAGRSRRFWPLAEKTLFPICGKTLLEHQVERLRAGGIREIILVGGAHNLEEAKTIFPRLPMVEQEDLDLGMRGALLSALPKLRKEAVMIVSGNDVIEPSGYRALLRAAKKPGTQGALLAQRVSQYFPGGYLTVEGGHITAIVEKPGAGKEPSDLVNIVAHVHSDASLLLTALENVKPRRDDGYEQALQRLFCNYAFRAAPYEGPWQPVKYPWHIVSLLQHLLEKITKPSIHPSAHIHPSAVIEGPVVVEAGVRVLPHATIVGPCFIGRESIVATGALVRQSSIGDHCVIGYGTEVKGSVLHSHIWTHMTYLGDSVIDRNTAFGAGCATGNFRLDEGEVRSMVEGEKIGTGLQKFGTAIGANARIGIQVGMNPGMKIGRGSFVSSGVLVSSDIPDDSFVSMRGTALVISKNRCPPPMPEARGKYKKVIHKVCG